MEALDQALYRKLIEANAEAFARQEYEVAYHALMAALHLVDHAGDEAQVEVIGRLARKQDEALEAVRPPHHLSRSAAAGRGQSALFATMRVHVDAVRLRLESERQRKGHADARR